MNKRTLYLKDLLQESDFQRIQDEAAIATNAAIITVDYSGTPVTQHSLCNDFCKNIRRNNKFSHLCEKCDRRGGVEAARLKKPYIYLCHMGIVDFAIPIIIDDIYMGAVMAGQLIVNDCDKDKLECIVSEKSFHYIQDCSLIEKYNLIPRMPLNKIIALSNIISYIINTFIKNMLSEKNIKLSSDNISRPLINNKSRQVIAPGINYIHNNYKTNFNLNQVAELCQISDSYFSRLFKKVTGYNFAQYVNMVRIMHAKKMLISTNISIASLSLELGYEDCGYFIKVFKRCEGITPNEYRNKHLNNENIIDNFKIKSLLEI